MGGALSLAARFDFLFSIILMRVISDNGSANACIISLFEGTTYLEIVESFT